MLHCALGDLYNIESCVFSPVDLGMPSSRPRKYSLLRLRSSVRCELRFGGPQSEFKQIMFRSLELDGGAYLQVPPSAWAMFCLEKAAEMKVALRGCHNLGRQKELVSAARKAAWKKYEEVWRTGQYQQGRRHIADLNQDPKNSFRVLRRPVPCILRSSDLVHLELGRRFGVLVMRKLARSCMRLL